MNHGRNYHDFIERKQREYGERFSDAGLSEQFVSYFQSGQRIKVRMSHGEELTGTVGVTTGWVPSFLLMRRSNSHGSIWTLSDRDEIVAVKRGREYVPVSTR